MDAQTAIAEEFCRMCPYLAKDGWRIEVDQYAIAHIWPPTDKAGSEMMKLPGMAAKIGKTVQTLELAKAIVRMHKTDKHFYKVESGCDRFIGVAVGAFPPNP